MSTLIILGTGLPDGNVTPEFIGQYFINTVPSAYIAVGLTDGDWVDVTDGGGGGGGIPVKIDGNVNNVIESIVPDDTGQILLKSGYVYISYGINAGNWRIVSSHSGLVPTFFDICNNSLLNRQFFIYAQGTFHIIVSGDGALARNIAVTINNQNKPNGLETVQGRLIITLENPGDAMDFNITLSHTDSGGIIPGVEPMAHIQPVTNTTTSGTFNISGQNKMFIYDIIYPNSLAGFPLGSALMFIKQAEIDMSVITVNT